VKRPKRRPIAAGLLVMLTAPLFGACPLLVWTGLGLDVHGFPLRDFGPLGIIYVVYLFGGIPAIVAGLVVGLAIRMHGWISPQHWRAVTGILTLAWITILGARVKFEPASLGLIAMLYFIVAMVFASWAVRVLIIKLGWIRKKTAPVLVH
jgi:hypothetical protein